jgi:Domain of unknown function (DUF1995)
MLHPAHVSKLCHLRCHHSWPSVESGLAAPWHRCAKPAAPSARRILRAYPGDWQVHLVNEGTGEAALVTTMPQRPSYRELEALIRWGSSGRRHSRIPVPTSAALCRLFASATREDVQAQAIAAGRGIGARRLVAVRNIRLLCGTNCRGTEGSNASRPLSERLRRELRWNQDSLQGRR